MLLEEQLVADPTLRASGCQALLEVPRVAIRDAAEPVDRDRGGGVGVALDRGEGSESRSIGSADGVAIAP